LLRSLGQNFLANTSILQRIAAAAKLAPGDVVLEVGPGTGNLTRCLLAQGASISAVEKDRRLITSLTQDFPQVPAYPSSSALLFVSLLTYSITFANFCRSTSFRQTFSHVI